MIINPNVRYISPEGTFTLQGMMLFGDVVRALDASNAKLAAIAAVVAPVGGATVDAEARTAIAAIIAGAT